MAAPLRKFCMCGLTIFQNGVVFPEIISSSIYRAFRTYFNLIGNHVATKERAYDCGLHRWTEVQHSRVLSVSPSGSRTVEKAFPLRRKIKTLNNMISTHIMSRKNIQLHHSGFITLDFSCACRNFTMSTRNTCNSDRADDAAFSSQREQEKGIQSTKAKRSSVEVDLNESIKPKKENIKTIPNLLTTLRMASAPFLGYLVVNENFTVALSIFTLAGVSDLLDGFIARNFKSQMSVLGTALDPLADKLLITVLSISMTSAGLIPLPLTALIVFRDLVLIAGGFYIRYRSLPVPPPRVWGPATLRVVSSQSVITKSLLVLLFGITLSRYFDISHATAKLSPTFISKLNTSLQLTLVAFSLAAPVFGFVNHIFLQTLWYAAGATTVLSGADYMWSWKKYVTLLEKDQNDL